MQRRQQLIVGFGDIDTEPLELQKIVRVDNELIAQRLVRLQVLEVAFGRDLS